MLTNVIYSFIDMTHGQIFQQRACAANKCSAFAYQSKRYHSSSRKCNGRSIRNLQTPGLSLYSRSPKNWSPYSDTRTQNRIHRQARTQSDPKAATVFNKIRTLFERGRYTGSGNFSAQRPRSWQKAGAHQDRSSLNIALIDWQPRSSHWLTNF
jgi:hypothetical protein